MNSTGRWELGSEPKLIAAPSKQSTLSNQMRQRSHKRNIQDNIPSCCSCAQSRNALIILIVEFETWTPGYVVWRQRQSERHSKSKQVLAPYCSMNRVSVESKWLPIAVIMGHEGIFHVRQRCIIIDRGSTVSRIPDGTCQINIEDKDCRHPQPWIHKVDPSLTTAVEESIHGDLPKPRKLWLSPAQPTAVKAIIRHSVVKGVRPESVGVISVNGNRGCC